MFLSAPWVDPPSRDCEHWCAPGNVLGAWTEVFYNLACNADA
jgi:hypothetical protein